MPRRSATYQRKKRSHRLRMLAQGKTRKRERRAAKNHVGEQ